MLTETSPLPAARSIPSLLTLLAARVGAAGAVLMEQVDGGNLRMIDSFPAGLADRKLAAMPGLITGMPPALRSTDTIMLPSAMTRWLGQRARAVLVQPVSARGEVHVLLCWTEMPAAGLAESVVRIAAEAADILADIIDGYTLAQRLRRDGGRLDAIMNSVALGIAFTDSAGGSLCNAPAADILGLAGANNDAADFAAAVTATRQRCHLLDGDEWLGEAPRTGSGPGLVPHAEHWLFPENQRVLRVESHAVGDTLNPGRFWLFTDVTPLWRNAQRLRETNDRLGAEVAERQRIEEELRDATEELRAYTSNLELRHANTKRQAKMHADLLKESEEEKAVLERSKLESERLANHDVLTGLYNRRAFNTQLQRIADAALAEGGALAVLFIDLDKFKSVNDTLGHAAGDALLKQVAEALKRAVRDRDIVARFGGDEFAVLTRLSPATARAQLEVIGERIRLALQIPVPSPKGTIDVCGTIGVAIAPDDTAELGALLMMADKAMYIGKQSGRNRVVFHGGGAD